MKILWHSGAPWAHSGYGSQTRVFTPRLRDLGHHVDISAFYGLQGQPLGWEGMTVFPGDGRLGNRLLNALARNVEADLVITLMDVWVLTSSNLAELPLASWVPVDHAPAPQKVIDYFHRTGARPIAMARFGEQMLQEAGLDPLYVPHGIDTSVFRPQPELREATRARMGLPRDVFVIGMVAANKGNSPPRKAFPQVFQAFAEFRRTHRDAFMYLHTDASGYEGINLGQLAEMAGVPGDAIRYTNPLHLELGMQPEEMAGLYSAFDVLANPSYGEGFGIPIVEAQACGVPVIVTDFSAMAELCGDGWAVSGDPWFDDHHKAFFKCPSVSDIADAMAAAYDRGFGVSEKAREFALDYDADLITEQYWVPALEQLEAQFAEVLDGQLVSA